MTAAAPGAAVVTGGGSGIGAAASHRLAGSGRGVVVVDVDEDAGAATCERIHRSRGTADLVVGDVAVPDTWDPVAEAASRLGGARVLVANAYHAVARSAGDLALEDWDRQLAVNLTGAFLAVRSLIGQLGERGGSIVLVSSVHAMVGLPGLPAYAASKGGLVALARQLAADYGPDVRVNAVLPGPIDTPAWDGAGQGDRSIAAEETIMGRFGSPDEVAAVIAFLASAEASYVTGAGIVVDGGWTVRKRA